MRLLAADCVEAMAEMEAESVHAVVCDPPYGLEFMGKEWDRLDHDAWRSGGGFSKPGIGDRPTPWASYGQGDAANATCSTCGGRMRGAKRCECDEPVWVVKGKPLDPSDARRSQAQSMQAWHHRWAVEALRVLKPGGYLLAFGGTRTSHRLACALEDSGFEIRDRVLTLAGEVDHPTELDWVYASGFPKGLDVSKKIDELAGAEREVVARRRTGSARTPRPKRVEGRGATEFGSGENLVEVTEPATEEARRWRGFSTALKPAHEPIVVARKPLQGTVAANVLRHGVGVLNIDGARVAHGGEKLGGGDERAERDRSGSHEGWQRPWMGDSEATAAAAGRVRENVAHAEALGRWPANVALVHTDGCVQVGARKIRNDGNWEGRTESIGYEGGWDTSEDADPRDRRVPPVEEVAVWECVPGCPVAELDGQSGSVGGSGPVRGTEPSAPAKNVYGKFERTASLAFYGDSGGASRFYFCAKASRAERNAGCEALAERPINWSSGDQSPGTFQSEGTNREARNPHPTVKPINLMRWLVRLVCPPGGTVLDPFAGSGTTGIACALEGFDFVGIERDREYVAIAEARIAFWTEHGEEGLRIVRERDAAEQVREVRRAAGQMELFGG